MEEGRDFFFVLLLQYFLFIIMPILNKKNTSKGSLLI